MDFGCISGGGGMLLGMQRTMASHIIMVHYHQNSCPRVCILTCLTHHFAIVSPSSNPNKFGFRTLMAYGWYSHTFPCKPDHDVKKILLGSPQPKYRRLLLSGSWRARQNYLILGLTLNSSCLILDFSTLHIRKRRTPRRSLRWIKCLFVDILGHTPG